MSFCNRRGFLIGASTGALAACGFQPVHRTGGPGSLLNNRITLPEARSPADFAFRERLRRQFGEAGGAGDWRLEYRLTLTETGAAIEQDLDVTRFNIAGRAQFKLVSVSSEPSFDEAEVRSVASFDATADAFATRSARKAAETRLAEELAERVSARLIAMVAS